MLIRVHALGITQRRSRPPLRTDKKRLPRDAPILGWTMQRTASNLGRTRTEVNVPKGLDASQAGYDAFAGSALFKAQ